MNETNDYRNILNSEMLSNEIDNALKSVLATLDTKLIEISLHTNYSIMNDKNAFCLRIFDKINLKQLASFEYKTQLQEIVNEYGNESIQGRRDRPLEARLEQMPDIYLRRVRDFLGELREKSSREGTAELRERTTELRETQDAQETTGSRERIQEETLPFRERVDTRFILEQRGSIINQRQSINRMGSDRGGLSEALRRVSKVNPNSDKTISQNNLVSRDSQATTDKTFREVLKEQFLENELQDIFNRIDSYMSTIKQDTNYHVIHDKNDFCLIVYDTNHTNPIAKFNYGDTLQEIINDTTHADTTSRSGYRLFKDRLGEHTDIYLRRVGRTLSERRARELRETESNQELDPKVRPLLGGSCTQLILERRGSIAQERRIREGNKRDNGALSNILRGLDSQATTDKTFREVLKEKFLENELQDIFNRIDSYISTIKQDINYHVIHDKNDFCLIVYDTNHTNPIAKFNYGDTLQEIINDTTHADTTSRSGYRLFKDRLGEHTDIYLRRVRDFLGELREKSSREGTAELREGTAELRETQDTRKSNMQIGSLEDDKKQIVGGSITQSILHYRGIARSCRMGRQGVRGTNSSLAELLAMIESSKKTNSNNSAKDSNNQFNSDAVSNAQHRSNGSVDTNPNKPNSTTRAVRTRNILSTQDDDDDNIKKKKGRKR